MQSHTIRLGRPAPKKSVPTVAQLLALSALPASARLYVEAGR
jgi:hypothetical protein